MTWVIGGGVMTGYSIGLSDIRITFADGSERDCLQKIYPVGPNIAAAFAGSVAIGFAMVENLAGWMQVPEGSEPVGFDPVEIAERWPTEAKRIFAAQPEAERKLQSHIMLLGVSPIAHNGNPAWPRTEVYTLKSPDFSPRKARPHEYLAIGIGASVFEDDLCTLSNNNDRRMTLMQGEIGNIGGMGTMLAIHFTDIVRRHQPRGISSHLHLCWVFLNRIVIRTNDHQRTGAWSGWNLGPDTASDIGSNFRMPVIAGSYQQLQELLQSTGQAVEGVIA
jgi:hypothetical protein